MSEDLEAAVGELVALFDIERIEDNVFRGQSGSVGWRRIYGGHVLAQAVIAAMRSVEPERLIHSLHGYFILPGDLKAPIVYEVEILRDGGSFSTRHIKARQHGRTIFLMAASFHKPETGLSHSARMPDVPQPGELRSARDLFADQLSGLPESMRQFWKRFLPIELRPVDISRYVDRKRREPVQNIWFKTVAPLPDEPMVHAAVLAYASDFALLETALAPHGKLLSDADVRLASLDHALWFHRPVRADEWLLYSIDCPNTASARGFCRGQLFTQDGELVASTAQEGLMRIG